MNIIKKLRKKIFYFIPPLVAGFIYRLVTGAMLHKRKFIKTRVSEGAYIDPTVQILGWKKVKVGEYSVISERCFLVNNFRNSELAEIVIGKNCHIGRNNFFSSGPLINISDYVFTGGDCRFLGCGHNIESPLKPYIASGLDQGGEINVKVNCWLATGVVVLYGVTIGLGCVVGAGSLVTKDIPDFTMGFGVPFVASKRYHFNERRWIKINEWKKEYEIYFPSEPEYLNILYQEKSAIVPALTSASSRFGWLE